MVPRKKAIRIWMCRSKSNNIKCDAMMTIGWRYCPWIDPVQVQIHQNHTHWLQVWVWAMTTNKYESGILSLHFAGSSDAMATTIPIRRFCGPHRTKYIYHSTTLSVWASNHMAKFIQHIINLDEWCVASCCCWRGGLSASLWVSVSSVFVVNDVSAFIRFQWARKVLGRMNKKKKKIR